jgi:hypothetical protein
MKRTIDKCVDSHVEMRENAWNGMGLWLGHARIKDYITRLLNLVTCAMKKNLEVNVDAKFYITYLFEARGGINSYNSTFAMFHPVLAVFLSIITLSLYEWIITLVSLAFIEEGILDKLEFYCVDL